jgi:hypothetical protein
MEAIYNEDVYKFSKDGIYDEMTAFDMGADFNVSCVLKSRVKAEQISRTNTGISTYQIVASDPNIKNHKRAATFVMKEIFPNVARTEVESWFELGEEEKQMLESETAQANAQAALADQGNIAQAQAIEGADASTFDPTGAQAQGYNEAAAQMAAAGQPAPAAPSPVEQAAEEADPVRDNVESLKDLLGVLNGDPDTANALEDAEDSMDDEAPEPDEQQEADASPEEQMQEEEEGLPDDSDLDLEDQEGEAAQDAAFNVPLEGGQDDEVDDEEADEQEIEDEESQPAAQNDIASGGDLSIDGNIGNADDVANSGVVTGTGEENDQYQG